tara:strand:- start:898 stop:1434 length:537 start_codon:yes stop_codon:yes gene_type:complete
MTAAATAVLRYEIDEASPETIVTADNDGETFAVFTNEVEFNQIRYNMQMTTGSGSTSPIVNSVVLNTILNPPRRKSWAFSVTVNSGVVLSGGGRASMSGNYLETFLFGGVQKRVTLYDRRGDRTYVGRIINVNGRVMQPRSDGDLEVFDVLFYEIADTTSGDVAIYNKDAYNVGKVYA